MLSGKNIVHISCAGSGKTTHIVESALSNSGEKVLITTYTNENIEQIREFLFERAGCIPENITILSWYTFLIQQGVRPYQNHMSNHRRVNSIDFRKKLSRYHKKDNYFTVANDIYKDKVSEFVYECNRKSDGLVVKRLERIYDRIFIDELQDLAGYDLELLAELFSSRITVEAVGDPRQVTYVTNDAQKNRQFRRSAIYDWLKSDKQSDQVIIKEKCDCLRCSQSICDLADSLYPEFPETTSKNLVSSGHDGVFLVHKDDVTAYVGEFDPVLLRYKKNSKTFGYRATNIGITKGRTFERVLVFPTGPMLEFLKTKDLSKAGDKSKLYVAITRARYSVAFVVRRRNIDSDIDYWGPS